MNAGQMVVQMPVGMTVHAAMQADSTTAAPSAGDQETTVFDGVMRGISPRETGKSAGAPGRAKSAHAESSATAETNAAQAQPETQPDVLTTLQAVLGAGVQVEPTEGKAGTDKQEAEAVQNRPDVQLPQNVVLAAAGSQIASAQQITGRMPEAELHVAGTGSERIPFGRIEAPLLNSVDAQPAQAVKQEPGTANNVGSSPDTDVSAPEKAVEGAAEAVRQPAVTTPEAAGRKAATGPALVDVGVQFDTQAANAPQHASQSITGIESQGADPERNTAALSDGSSKPADSPQPDSASATVRIVSGTDTVQKTTAATAEVAVGIKGTDIPAASAAPPELTPVEGTPVLAENTVAAASARPNMDAYFQTSVRPATFTMADSRMQAAQTTTPLAAVVAPSNVPPANVAAQRPVREEARPQNELMAAQEQPVVRQGSTEGTAKSEVVVGNAMAAAVKEAESTASGEKFGQSGNGTGDQGMNGQAHLAMSHQVKFDNALSENAAPVAAAGDSLRNDQAEQIASQVKEHLAGREIKTGTEQIVIRLSPENLGELKLNLRMENQCLKVEIVADTPMARDALLKHSDTLKESLARQNITMESFDVSTGGNKFGTASQNQSQGDWRELARQRQYSAWASAGGYNLGDVPDIQQLPVYQASTAHSMVDVHY
jgi:flagellar hook-length control protein FliK